MSDTVKPTRAEVNTLPTTTGIYIFYQGKEIIYIGKSVSLKARLLSHIENAKIDAKEAAIVNNADKIKIIVTDSEFKALLLESQLISKHKPKYNVRWRDDKSYLYIKCTIKDDYPKFYLTRREYIKGNLYFGPFPAVRTATNVLREIRKVFPFCTQQKITKKPCFYSKIGLCDPCPNFIEHLDTAEKQHYKRIYRYNVKQAVKVLEGKTDLVLNSLYKQLKELTTDEKYEEALILRNRIYRLEGLIHGKRIDPDELTDYNRSQESMEKLKAMLIKFFPDLKMPRRIECYDISNLSQKNATASMVVFTEGLINKKEYRKFKIKDLKLNNDFEMMYEVLKRRFKHHEWDDPDLVVVDGGKPQVRIALRALSELNVTIPLIGIAKHPDRLVIGNENGQMIRPDYRNPGFNLIRALRDESHRFAKKYHIFLREKKMMI